MKFLLSMSIKDDMFTKHQWALMQNKQLGFFYLVSISLKFRVQLFFLAEE